MPHLEWCDAGAHAVPADQLLTCPSTGETTCHECQDRLAAQVMAEIYAELDQLRTCERHPGYDPTPALGADYPPF